MVFWPSLVLYRSQKDPWRGNKTFEALILMIDMIINALLPCQVTYGGHFLFLKTWNCLLSMAKTAKLGFGPTLALYHNHKDPWGGHEMFWRLSTCDIHDKQCTISLSSHSWGLLSLPKNPTLCPFYGKNGKTGFWANFSPIWQPKRPLEGPWNGLRP